MRRRVLELAGQLGYTPNPAARNLVTSRTEAVGLVIRRRLVGTSNPFYDRIIMGIEMELEKKGYHLVLSTIDEEQRSQLPPGLDVRRLDGLIVVGPELSGRTMTTLLSLGLPTVLAANTLDHMDVDAVTSCNREGACAATKHLIEHGHEHIAYLGGRPQWSPLGDRLVGYRETMRGIVSSHMSCRRRRCILTTGARISTQALEEHSEISAVFAANDPLAIGAMQASRELGRSVPDDIAIIGYDNIAWSETTEPPLTTVYIHKQQMGRLAARRLLDLMEEGPQPAISTYVANELVIRRSCGCHAEAAPLDHDQNVAADAPAG